MLPGDLRKRLERALTNYGRHGRPVGRDEEFWLQAESERGKSQDE
ncbi:DUF2934 domain-containing protein [Bradyrhizobium sp. AUGA SZCCT0274]